MKNNILLIGSGGRESALLHAILKSNSLNICYFAPGIPQVYFNEKLQFRNIDISQNDIVIKFCKENNVNFVICGPELPLCNGIIDDLEKNGISAYGPNKNASQLEGSKIFMKDVLQKAGVPTAKYQTFTNRELTQALEFLKSFVGKVVIKTDGLASGKGVYICESFEESSQVLQEFFAGKFGNAGKSVVIEEFLEGREVSVFALCDGKNAIPFYHACDYKKISEGDVGLNTGGMGSFAPSFLTQNQFNEIVNKYFNATLEELQNRGIAYKGFLFGGLIITKDGPKFLEYNIRMGDPETQSIMPLLNCDFLEILLKSYKGELTQSDIKFTNNHAVTVVLASGGYPLEFQKHKEITGLDDVSCFVFSSGLYKKDNKFFTDGGRVMSITATANNQIKAREEAYKNVQKIVFDNIYYRKDIAK
jgi:phosphoribosylamine--glycine ligase